MSDSTEVDALGAMYQGEKTDSIGVFNVAMLMMAIAVGYIGTSLTLSGDFGHGVPWSMVLLLPFPLWLVAVYHSLVALSGMTHGISMGILETELYGKTGLPQKVEPHHEVQRYVGSQMSNRIMDITQAHPLHKVTSGFVYGGFYSAIIAYTVYIVAYVWNDVPLWQRIAGAVGYSALLALVGATWKLGFKLLDEGNKVVELWRTPQAALNGAEVDRGEEPITTHPQPALQQ
jgi:hypothetical protein